MNVQDPDTRDGAEAVLASPVVIVEDWRRAVLGSMLRQEDILAQIATNTTKARRRTKKTPEAEVPVEKAPAPAPTATEEPPVVEPSTAPDTPTPDLAAQAEDIPSG